MLGVLLQVVAQELCPPAVGLCIARALRRSGNGVDVGFAPLNAAVRLRTLPEDAETTEVEIEEVGTRVDAPQRSVQLEVVALVALHEPP